MAVTRNNSAVIDSQDFKSTDVAILAGGQGTRLRSIIGESQKVMAKVQDQPFLDILINYLEKQEIRRITLLTGYKSEMIKLNYFQDHWEKIIFQLQDEAEPLGTGGAIKNARSLLKSDPFFVLNGDSFCDVDFKSLLKFHKEHKGKATVVVSRMEDTRDYGTIEYDPRNYAVLGFYEKRPQKLSGYVNAGVYCFNQSIFELLDDKCSLEKHVLDRLGNQNRILGSQLFAFPTKEEFLDIGTPERYDKAQKILRQKGMI